MARLDKAKTAEYAKKYRQENLEKVRAYQRKYQNKKRAENRERQREYDRKWYAKNTDRALGYYFKKKYGHSPKNYEQLIQSCGNKCAVCGLPFGNARKPHVDHCHNTNVVRGVLCGACNKAEGYLRTPENALKLYEYMKRNELFYQGKN